MDSRDIITLIIGFIGSGGLFAAIAAYRKSKPEAGKIIVDTAQGVLLMQTGVMKDLKEEVVFLRGENARILKENKELRDRLEEVEDKMKELTKRTSVIEQHGTS